MHIHTCVIYGKFDLLVHRSISKKLFLIKISSILRIAFSDA